MKKLIFALLYVLASCSANHCNSTQKILECSNLYVSNLPKFYAGEESLKLENIQGLESWNSSTLTAVNTLFGINLTLTKDAFESFLEIPHLSKILIFKSEIDFAESTVINSVTLEELSLRESVPNNVSFKLPHLLDLDLSSNQFIAMPKIDGENISFLNVSNNHMMHLKKLEMLPSLEELALNHNFIKEINSDAFENNEYLKRISLRNNDLSTINFKAPALMILELSGNSFEIIDGELFAGTPEITTLFLDRNMISEMKDPFKYLKHLRFLDLSNNDLQKLDGRWFTNTLELETLKLSHNYLTRLPTLYLSLPTLHLLEVINNNLEALDYSFFSKTRALARLDVSFNYIENIDDAVQFWNRLNKLNIANNEIYNLKKGIFKNAENLNFLNISQNHLYITLDVFENNKLLRDLDVSNNYITKLCVGDSAPDHIRNLDISNNQVKSLQCLHKMTSVHLSGNPLNCNAELQKKLQEFQSIDTDFMEPSSDMLEGVKKHNNDVDGVLVESNWEAVYHKLCPGVPLVVEVTTTSSPKSDLSTIGPINNGRQIKIIDDNNIVYKDIVTEKEELSPAEISSSFQISEILKKEPESSFPETSSSTDDLYDDDGLNHDYDDLDQERKEYMDRVLSFKFHHGINKSWNSWAFVLLGICLFLLIINTVLFFWFKSKQRADAMLGSDRPYKQIPNQVYKNTTKPVTGSQISSNIGRALTNFKNEKVPEIFIKCGFKTKMGADKESKAQMIPADELA